jgi:hypothetical protein
MPPFSDSPGISGSGATTGRAAVRNQIGLGGGRIEIVGSEPGAESGARRRGVATLKTMNVCLFDLASLRFERSADRGVVLVRTASGELLASSTVPVDADEGRCAATVCDEALARGTVLRYVDGQGDMAVPIALYNPYSGDVAVDALPHTRAFGDGRPLRLDPNGALAVLDGDTLVVDGRPLAWIPAGAVSCSRALAAHPDPI